MLVAVGWSGSGQLLSSGTLDLLRWDNSSFHLKLAFPIDLLLIVGPLAKVDMEGRRVPPNAISTSFGGCLKFKQKNNVNPRGLLPGASAGCL